MRDRRESSTDSTCPLRSSSCGCELLAVVMSSVLAQGKQPRVKTTSSACTSAETRRAGRGESCTVLLPARLNPCRFAQARRVLEAAQELQGASRHARDGVEAAHTRLREARRERRVEDRRLGKVDRLLRPVFERAWRGSTLERGRQTRLLYSQRA